MIFFCFYGEKNKEEKVLIFGGKRKIK